MAIIFTKMYKISVYRNKYTIPGRRREKRQQKRTNGKNALSQQKIYENSEKTVCTRYSV
jgi:hypothetical protein